MRLDSTTVAVVTGAASGIGAALARDLDRRGVRLALCDLDEGRLCSLADTLQRPPLTARVDVSDEQALSHFAEQVVSALGPPDLVVANAGIAYLGPFAEGRPEDFRRVIDVNLWGVVHTVRAFLPSMIAARRGTLVTLSSVFGLVGIPGQTAYCAAKAAVKGFAESLDQEVRQHGLNVLCVHPGAVATDIAVSARHSDPDRTRENARRIIARGLPPATAAARILTAVERGDKRLLIGRDARLLAWLQRVLPVRYRDLVLRYTEGR